MGKKIRRDNSGKWYCALCGEQQENYGKALWHIKSEHTPVDKVYTETQLKIIKEAEKERQTNADSQMPQNIPQNIADAGNSLAQALERIDRRLNRMEFFLTNREEHRPFSISIDWKWFVAGCVLGLIIGYLFFAHSTMSTSSNTTLGDIGASIIKKTTNKLVDKVIGAVL